MNDKQNARIVYADIINLPHFQSQKRPHMSLYDRAAQFAPFAALTGFDDMVTEEARLTDKPIELSEIELETLNRKMDLVELLLQDGGHPTLSFTYFEPDVIKEGGRYLTRIGIVKKIDTFTKKLILYGSDDIEKKSRRLIYNSTGLLISADFQLNLMNMKTDDKQIINHCKTLSQRRFR